MSIKTLPNGGPATCPICCENIYDTDDCLSCSKSHVIHKKCYIDLIDKNMIEPALKDVFVEDIVSTLTRWTLWEKNVIERLHIYECGTSLSPEVIIKNESALRNTLESGIAEGDLITLELDRSRVLDDLDHCLSKHIDNFVELITTSKVPTISDPDCVSVSVCYNNKSFDAEIHPANYSIYDNEEA